MFCEVASKVVQGLSRIPFYNKNKTFLLAHFQPMFHSYAPRKHQKTSDFFMFSGGNQVERWLQMGLISFIIFTCLF